MNKRASLIDSIYMPIYILLVGCTIFIAYYVWINFVDVFTPIATNVNFSDGSNLTSTMTDITVSIGYLDYMFPFLVFGLLIVSLIFAFKSGVSVVYSYLSIVMWVLAVMISIILSNIFELFAQQFISIGGVFTIISFIMENMKWIALIWAFLISIVMFTRSQQESQNLAAAERVFG